MISILVFVLLTVPAQTPEPKQIPTPVPVSARAYHPKANETAYLNRQLWSADKDSKNLNQPIKMTRLGVTKPDGVVFAKFSELYKGGVPQDQVQLSKMTEAGDLAFIATNTRVSVIKVHPELGDSGYFYPVEIKILDGPARDIVVWTGFNNLSRNIDSGMMSDQRKLDIQTTLAKRKARDAQKAMLRAAKSASDQIAARQDYEAELKMAPVRAQMQTEALRQQSQILDMQAQQMRIKNLQELNQLIRQDRVQQQMRNGGVMFGPNGPILPGDPLPGR